MRRFLKIDRLLFFVIGIMMILTVNAQTYLEREDGWVNAQISTMTLDEKIGQLFMVRAYSKGNKDEENLILDYIKKYHLGGLCFFQGSPETQSILVNKFQKASKTPMLMALDAEWGLGMRFPNETISFPKQMMLGAVQNNQLIYEMGKEIARQCKATGININFAPVVDINSNPRNPVIFDRSFGELPFHVTSKGYLYIKGMEEEGVLACVKHFPGHGDTQVDSHYELPIISHSKERLEEFEFFPFRRLASQGVAAVMVGHLHIPSIDNRPKLPASMSDKLVKGILRDEMGFQGLIFTDAMDMKAVTKHYPSGIAEAEAFLAGNDIILLPDNLPNAFNAIKSYISNGKITDERLDESVYRILRAKYKIGLHRGTQVSENNIFKSINNKKALALKQSIAESSMTIVSDKSNLFPWRNIDDKTVAVISVNQFHTSKFQERMSSYLNTHNYHIMPTNLRAEYAIRLKALSEYDDVVIAIHSSGKSGDFSAQIPDLLVKFIGELQKKTRVRVIVFGNPYLLNKFEKIDHLAINYDNDSITQDATVQGIMGVFNINGKLPFSSGDKFKAGYGIDKEHLDRLGYAWPEMVYLNTDTLTQIDSIMNGAMKLGAFPGGQVVISKDRRIVFQKNYGKLSPNESSVQNNTIYDLASITKILSTTLTTMHLYDRNKVDLDAPLKRYIAKIDTTNKADITIGELLAHRARLNPWIPFYKNTLPDNKNQKMNNHYYQKTLKDNFTIPVAKNLFLRDDYIDSIYSQIYVSNIRENHTDKYSDLGFYLLYKMLNDGLNGGVEDYLNKHFYKKLGLRFTGFNPFKVHDLRNIAPSEIDNYYRHQIIRGHVQDMGAAMLGGIAGHSGLFSTATEVTTMMQMLLNKGKYGGVQFLKQETVEMFTTRHPQSTRRGYGFDMKEMDSLKKQNVSPHAPFSVFGHTGYTGTATWADPVNNIVYTFISNRTYPKSNNQTLNNRKIREKIQSVIYRSMFNFRGSV